MTQTISSTNETAVPPPVSFAPLTCPPFSEPAASLHPRVYLVPDAHGTARCPYCGACYATDKVAGTAHA